MKINLPVTGVGQMLAESDVIVSKTDLKGAITYVNDDFVRISGFSRDELIGASHNIVRHPDMPPEAFADLWNSLKAGRPWSGLVKNRCKNGDHYWVLANATPIFEDARIVGYMSVRSKPTRAEVDAAENAYRLFREGKAVNLEISDGRVVKSGWAAKLNLLRNSSIRARLSLIIALMSALLLLVGTIGMLGMSATDDGLHTVYLDRTVPIARIGQMSRLMLRSRIEIDSAIGEQDFASVGRHLDQVERNLDEFDKLWSEYGASDLTVEEKRLSERFAADWAKYLNQGVKPVLLALHDGRIAEARDLVNHGMTELYAGVSRDIDEIDRLKIKLAGEQFDKARSMYYMLRNLACGVIAAGILLAILVRSRMIRAIVAPLDSAIGHFRQISQGNYGDAIVIERHDEIGKVLEALKTMQIRLGFELAEARRVSAENLAVLNGVGRMLGALSRGDLTERISEPFSGTFARLTQNSNETADQLQRVIFQISEATATINAAIAEIVDENANLSQRTEQQAASLAEIAASMDQLAATVGHSVDNAQQATTLASGASAIAEQGGQVVGRVVETMAAINEGSRQIVEIISVIDGIAFQTNILALNAAVEAARAGEQGRGFAVVAGEVRNLAQRSATAAKEIKQLINDSAERVDGGSKLVIDAGQTMQQIVAAVRRVTDTIANISAAAVEQSSGIEQVNQAISQIDQVTQQNASLVQQSAAAAQLLEQQAATLVEQVARFRLG